MNSPPSFPPFVVLFPQLCNTLWLIPLEGGTLEACPAPLHSGSGAREMALSPGSSVDTPPNKNPDWGWDADQEPQLRQALHKRSSIDCHCHGWLASGAARIPRPAKLLYPKPVPLRREAGGCGGADLMLGWGPVGSEVACPHPAFHPPTSSLLSARCCSSLGTCQSDALFWVLLGYVREHGLDG